MIWGAVIAAGISLVGSYMSKKSADKKLSKQEQMNADQLALAKEQLGFTKQQYEDWQQRYDPVFKDMMNELNNDLEPNYAAIAGDVKSAFQSARGQEQRQMMRYGIKPTDGNFRKSARDYGINEAAAHVGTRMQARESKRGQKFARLGDIYAMGSGLTPTMMNSMNAAYSNNLGAYRNGMDMYGFQAGAKYQMGMNMTDEASSAIGGVDWGAIGQSMGWSDLALKENVIQIGERAGVKIYRWDWNRKARNMGITGATCGVIAQEHLDSGFVHKAGNGFYMVDLPGLIADRIKKIKAKQKIKDKRKRSK